MNELALFAGAGGGILGGHMLGWSTVCAVEYASYPRSTLLRRQSDGMLPRFPIWDDVRTFDGKPWRGHVDVVSGGFPCQDISTAGRGAGIDGERSGLWKEMARIICEVRPRFAFMENSPALTSRGLGVVFGDLAAMGYNAAWGVLGAHHFGAPHKRDRIWILAELSRNELANTTSIGQQRQGGEWFNSDPAEVGEGQADHSIAEYARQKWGIEPGLGRVANGVANRVDRLKAIGNGQVPIVAAMAFRILRNRLQSAKHVL